MSDDTQTTMAWPAGRRVAACGRRPVTRTALLAILCAVAGSPAQAQRRQGPAPADPAGVAVLDTHGFWRLHHTLSPPVLQTPDGLKPALLPQDWLNIATSPPPADKR